MRGRLVGDVAASLVLSGRPLEDEDRAYAAEIVHKTFKAPLLWGQGAVPAFILRYWAAGISKAEGADRLFAQVLRAIIESAWRKMGRCPHVGLLFLSRRLGVALGSSPCRERHDLR